MQKIILKRNGTVVLQYIDDLEENIQEKMLKAHEIMLAFDIPATIETDFTLRNLFQVLFNYDSLMYIQPFLFQYMDKVESLPKINCKNGYRSIVIDGLNKLNEHDFSIEMNTEPDPNNKNFRIVGLKYLDLEEQEKPFRQYQEYYFHASLLSDDVEDDITYAMDFVSIEDILDVPIILGKHFYQYSQQKRINETKTEDTIDINTSYELSITLFEIINAVLTEITFHGLDEEKETKLKDLNIIEKQISDKG